MPISDALSFWHGGALLLANTRARSATAPRLQRHHNPPVQLPGVAWARGEAMTQFPYFYVSSAGGQIGNIRWLNSDTRRRGYWGWTQVITPNVGDLDEMPEVLP
jgi:hypothetical protein